MFKPFNKIRNLFGYQSASNIEEVAKDKFDSAYRKKRRNKGRHFKKSRIASRKQAKK